MRSLSGDDSGLPNPIVLPAPLLAALALAAYAARRLKRAPGSPR